jgi:hypothetical protein
MESSTYAKLRYVTLKLDEVYTEFFIGLCSMHNGKLKITVQNTRKVSVFASLRFLIEYRII